MFGECAMTASLTPAVMPARHLGPIAIFQWPLAWAMVCLLLAVDFVWASQVGLTIGGVVMQAGLIGAPLALSAAYRRRNRRYSEHGRGMGFVVRFHPHGCVLSYLAASCAFPLQDVMMERLDRAIGFDWSAWHDAVLDRPILSWPLLVAYTSLLPQSLLSIIYFPATDKSARIGELLLLAGATLAATVLISAIWPALGPFAAHGPNAGPFAAHGGGDVAYLRDLLALRAGGPWHFELSAMEGIVTMPSYHTVDGRAAHLRLSPHRPSRIWDRNAELGDAAVDPADRRALSGRHARRRGAGARSDRRPASAAAWSEPNSVRPLARDIGRQGPRFGPRLRFQA